MTQSKTIAWLVPCLNEEAAIGGVVRDIRAHCPSAVVYVYDNGSTDQTAAVAAAAGAVVRREPRRGKGTVVRSMFLDVDCDVAIMIDGDGTYDVASWRQLAEPVLSGEADMVVATRLGDHAPGAFRSLHHWGNRLISGTIRRLFKAPLSDVLSGYRAFSRRFMTAVGVDARSFEIEVELTIQAMQHRLRVQETPVRYSERRAGGASKLRTFRDGFLISFAILRLLKDVRPIAVCWGMAALAVSTGGALIAAERLELGLFAWTFATIAGFSGLILNAIAQRGREHAEAILKATGAGRAETVESPGRRVTAAASVDEAS